MKKIVLGLLTIVLLTGCIQGTEAKKYISSYDSDIVVTNKALTIKQLSTGAENETTLLDAFTLVDGELVPKEKKSITVHYTLDGKDVTFDFEYAESEGCIVPLTYGGVPTLNISYFVTPIPNNTKECIIHIGEVYSDKNTSVSSDKLLNLASGEITTFFDETNQEELVNKFFETSQNERVMFWATTIALNPSGDKLLFSSDRENLYWIKDLVTKAETPITVSGINYLGWKNDREIFFQKDSSILNINVDSLEATKIVDETTHPGWSYYSNYIIHGTYESLLITDLLTMKEYSYGESNRHFSNITRSPDNQKIIVTFSGLNLEDLPDVVVYNLTDNSKRVFSASDFDNNLLCFGYFIDNDTLLIKGQPLNAQPDSKFTSYIVSLND